MIPPVSFGFRPNSDKTRIRVDTLKAERLKNTETQVRLQKQLQQLQHRQREIGDEMGRLK